MARARALNTVEAQWKAITETTISSHDEKVGTE